MVAFMAEHLKVGLIEGQLWKPLARLYVIHVDLNAV